MRDAHARALEIRAPGSGRRHRGRTASRRAPVAAARARAVRSGGRSSASPATVSIPPRPTTYWVSRRAVGVSPLRPGARAAREARPDATGIEHLALDPDRRLVEDACDVCRLDGDLRRVALVERVGRPEQQHPLPGIRERDAHGIVRNRQRRRPGPVELAAAGARPSTGGRAAAPPDPRGANAVDPRVPSRSRPCAPSTESVSPDRRSRTSAPLHATLDLPEPDHLGV